MKERIKLTAIFNAHPQTIYDAWLDSDLHSKMTAGEAICSAKVNESFSTWNGYISGENLALKPNAEIVQAWRTTEFSETDEDSILTIQLKEIENGTELTLIHTNIPAGQTQYEKGWKEHYFEPMKKLFG
ncbi:MAG: SRPBCC domain-containing protein [Bacteroidia bacterium]